MNPTARADAAALMAIATAFMAALVPQSAGADLFTRALALQFGPKAASFGVPQLALPSADCVGEAQAIPVVEESSATLVTRMANQGLRV